MKEHDDIILQLNDDKKLIKLIKPLYEYNWNNYEIKIVRKEFEKILRDEYKIVGYIDLIIRIYIIDKEKNEECFADILVFEIKKQTDLNDVGNILRQIKKYKLYNHSNRDKLFNVIKNELFDKFYSKEEALNKKILIDIEKENLEKDYDKIYKQKLESIEHSVEFYEKQYIEHCAGHKKQPVISCRCEYSLNEIRKEKEELISGKNKEEFVTEHLQQFKETELLNILRSDTEKKIWSITSKKIIWYLIAPSITKQIKEFFKNSEIGCIELNELNSVDNFGVNQ